jgi:hypothetical protein|tara:strand:+ start:1599 stop:1838 length:240 start_codon:yes stop_codon:yes gene_type:complete
MAFDEHLCMLQSYRILTGKDSFDTLLEEFEQVELVFDPTRKVIVMEDDIYDLVRYYFEAREDYKKCAEIQWAKCKAKSF